MVFPLRTKIRVVRLKEKFLTAFDSYAYVTYGDVVMAIENIVKEIVGAE